MKINNKELPYTVRKKQATETAFERAQMSKLAQTSKQLF